MYLATNLGLCRAFYKSKNAPQCGAFSKDFEK
jgi:hypothetical protein